jgi:hypothetical protein
VVKLVTNFELLGKESFSRIGGMCVGKEWFD